MRASQAETLFGPPQPIKRADEVRAGYTHREPCQTEAKAAINLRPISGKRRMQVLRAIAEAGFTGITRQEITDIHGIRLQSVCSAVTALKDGNFVIQTDRERSGRSVLVCSERGYRQAARGAA